MNGMDSKIAYFTMEIGLTHELPTYSGGLGVLSGDTIKSAADLKLPMVVVTLLHQKGYFEQTLTEQGWQEEHDVLWDPGRSCPHRTRPRRSPSKVVMSPSGRGDTMW